MARSSDSVFPISLLRDKTFQAREIRRVILLSATYLVITTLLIGVFYHQMLGRLLEGAAPLLFVSEDSALANEAIPALGTVLTQWMLAMLAINTVITIGVAIYITRKLGQPILAIKRALREIGSGNLDVRLRHRDNNDFNEIVKELDVAMRSVRAQVGAAKQSMDKFSELQSQPDVSDTYNSEVDAALENCRSALNFFQVSSEQQDSANSDNQSSDDNGSQATASP